uniref:Uncharacterized protein n=1 Tax=Trichobilharzia regenti TaxID=157069 RepID=A0AA85JPA2_TRIRE|nr:unnamed protein product [Trichobilharzia regenti]
MFGRRLRTTLDTIIPIPSRRSKCGRNSEFWFNRRHGTKQRSFMVGQSVLVRDYIRRDRPWVSGVIVGRKGQVIYKVKVGDLIWVRHANQIRNRLVGKQLNDSKSADVQFELLIDTTDPKTSHGQNSRNKGKVSQQPRRSQRQPRPPKYLQVIPRYKSYR